MRIAVFIFDWDWKHIGSKVFEFENIDHLKDVMARHALSVEAAKSIKLPDNILDIHTAMAILEGNDEPVVTPAMIEDIRKGYQTGTIPLTTEFEV